MIARFKKNYLSKFLILIIFSLLIFLAGCQKFTKDYANVAEPEDKPQYTIGYDKNISPAAGAPKKP
jgi:hypothetical protein